MCCALAPDFEGLVMFLTHRCLCLPTDSSAVITVNCRQECMSWSSLKQIIPIFTPFEIEGEAA